MNSSEDFRNKFYDKYYTNQAGRNEAELTEKLYSDHRSYERSILPYLPGDRQIRILDVGCGYGSLVQYLSELGYQNVEGIDISREQIEQAKRIGVENIQQADLFDYLSGQRTWDIIIAMDLIEHFNKNEVVELLELIRTSLSGKGRFIGRTPNIDAPFGTAYAYGDFTHGVILNRSSAMQLFRSLNFSKVMVEPAPLLYYGGLKGWIQKWGYYGMYAFSKFLFFVTARSMTDVLLSPNMIICADR